MDFAIKKISTWKELTEVVESKSRDFIFRGQPDDLELKTSIERALLRWDIKPKSGRAIEFQTIREFRRRLQDPLHHRVHKDTLYCLSLMAHHGAPTRLLDCTYSPFVAAAFAMQEGIFPLETGREKRVPVIWCINGNWCIEETKKIVGTTLIEQRRRDRNRNDDSFGALYGMAWSDLERASTYKFVYAENPLPLNDRLTIQQGVFLCPGDLNSRFVDNLQAMPGWNQEANILKLRLELEKSDAVDVAKSLKKMNLGFAALFPGLDGFARSIGQQIVHYSDLADLKTGV